MGGKVRDGLEDERAGKILVAECHVEIPPGPLAEVRAVAGVLGGKVGKAFRLMRGMRPVTEDPVEALLNNTWRPTLSVTGVEGIPALADAGNVLRPKTALKLSLRLPPTADADLASRRVKEVLEADPPYGARVTYASGERPGTGWNAPGMADWLRDSVGRASTAQFGAPAMFDGLGGSIPFMAMLGERFPRAQFLVTGGMGPGSNPHGPNEFIDLATGGKVTACVAQVIADHGASRARCAARGRPRARERHPARRRPHRSHRAQRPQLPRPLHRGRDAAPHPGGPRDLGYRGRAAPVGLHPDLLAGVPDRGLGRRPPAPHAPGRRRRLPLEP